MKFNKEKPRTERQPIVRIEKALYEQIRRIAEVEGVSMQEAASRLVEAGIQVYEMGKEENGQGTT